jgi:hypothetical protein
MGVTVAQAVRRARTSTMAMILNALPFFIAVPSFRAEWAEKLSIHYNAKGKQIQRLCAGETCVWDLIFFIESVIIQN